MTAKRDLDTDNLIVKESASFSDVVITDIGDASNDGDAVNLRTLNAATMAGGWDEALFNSLNGDLKFYILKALDFTLNLDGRYQTESQVNALINAQSKVNETVILPSASSVANRLAGSTTIPSGWTLTADNLDLKIEHNNDRYVTDVKIFATTTSPENQQLRGTAAENGIVNVDTNNVTIKSLATIEKEIYIFITFAQ